MRTYLLSITILFSITACKKENCQTCTKTIGGVAGNFTDEVREVCDDDEATELEESSSGTTVWTCE
jgi:hypothetical protein